MWWCVRVDPPLSAWAPLPPFDSITDPNMLHCLPFHALFSIIPPLVHIQTLLSGGFLETNPITVTPTPIPPPLSISLAGSLSTPHRVDQRGRGRQPLYTRKGAKRGGRRRCCVGAGAQRRPADMSPTGRGK